MSFNLEDIVNQIKEVEETNIQKEKGGYKGDPRLLTLKKNCTYVIRLIPNINDSPNTFVTFKEIGFTSRVTNAYVYGGRSPQDAGLKKDPFKETQWDHYSKANERGDDAEKKASYKLLPQRKQLVNGYLVSVVGEDPEAKEKIGSVVVVRYPAQVDKEGNPLSDIYKRIYSALYGDKAKKIGKKSLDLSSEGRSLIIKVTEKGGYNNYSETEFDEAEDLGLSKERIQEIHKSAHDLTEFIPEVKSNEEIKELLDKHWFGTSANLDDELEDEEDEPVEQKPTKKTKVTAKVTEEEDKIPFDDGDDLEKLLEDV